MHKLLKLVISPEQQTNSLSTLVTTTNCWRKQPKLCSLSIAAAPQSDVSGNEEGAGDVNRP